MSSLDRFKKQQAALDQKKELFKRYQESLAKKRAQRQAGTSIPQSGPAAASSAQTLEHVSELSRFPSYGKAGIPLYCDDRSGPLHPDEALVALVNLYLEAAETGSANLVLMWPGVLRTLPLVHALATMEHWALGNKKGLRGLLYPAKANTFYRLNHLFLGRAEILRWVKEWASESYRSGSKSNLEKENLLFRLSDDELGYPGEGKETRPCVNELLPHFFKSGADADWGNYSEELLKHIARRLRRVAYKKFLHVPRHKLGDPEMAPDALFALSYRLVRRELREALTSLKKVGPPKVVLVDATRPMRVSIEGWRSRVLAFFEAFMEVFPKDRPGVLLVTDDPGICFRLREQLNKRVRKALSGIPDSQPLHLQLKPMVCTANGEGLILADERPPVAPEPRMIRLEVTDVEASHLVRRLYRIASGFPADSNMAKSLRLAADYLHKLAALPSSVEVLTQWLDERGADTRFREQFSWPAYRANLMAFIDQGQAREQCADLQKVMELADHIWHNYQDGTPFAYKLAREVGVTGTSPKRIAVVFTRAMYKVLAERFLQAYGDYDRGKNYADFADRVHFVLSSQLDEELASGWASRYVFAGIDNESLQLLVTDNRIPSESVVLLTHRAGLYTRWTLKPIFEFEQFKGYKPRIETMLAQLNEQLGADDRSLLPNDDFVLPSFSFAASNAGSDVDVDEAEAWRILIDDGRVLIRRGTSMVYLYDPAKEDAGFSGFRSVEVQNLREGDRLFVMSEDLHEMMEDYLKQANVSISRDKPFESSLRQYHDLVMRRLNERFPGPNLTAQIRALRERILAEHPDIKDLPEGMRNWVNLGSSADTPFERLAPQAPRKFVHFQAFAQALGFSSTEIAYFWQCAIQSIRVNRRIDGRYISDAYTRLLFDPESTIVHAGLSRAVTAHLYEQARESVHLVVSVTPPAQLNKEEN